MKYTVVENSKLKCPEISKYSCFYIMWGNLAGRLANTDLNATLEKISNTVAPRQDDYESDDDDADEEEEEDDDDEYEDEGYETGKFNDEDDNPRSSFGLVGMLTRALDDRQRQTDKENDECIEEELEEEVNDKDQDEEEEEGRSEVDFNSSTNEATTKIVTQTSPHFLQNSDMEASPAPTTVDLTDQQKLSLDDDSRKSLYGITRPQAGKPAINWSGQDENEHNVAFQMEQQKERFNIETKRRLHNQELPRHQPPTAEKEEIEIEHKRIETRDIQGRKGQEEEMSDSDFMRKEAEAERLRKDVQHAKRLPLEKENLQLEAETAGKSESTHERRQSEAETKQQNEEKSQRQEAKAMMREEDILRMDMQRKADVMKGNDSQEVDILVKSETGRVPPAVDRVATEINVRPDRNGDSLKRPQTPEYHESTRLMETEFRCRELQTRLEMAEQEIDALRHEAQREKQRTETEKDDLIARFQDKEARLLKATNEANENQTMNLEHDYKERIVNLEQKLSKERKAFQEEKEEYKKLLVESNAKLENAEKQMQASLKRFENEIGQSQQREERALSKADDRVAQSMAVLDERNEEIARLKTLIREMESKVNEHEEGVEEAEEELEELQHENDSLRVLLEKLQKDNTQLKDKVETLENESEMLAGLQMEMNLVKEDLSRERTKNQTVVDSAISSHTQIESERDTALSELRDVKQQLAAALGDLEVARADNTRIMAANTNLQAALEAFQAEREAEMEIFDEQRQESEEAIKAAHEAATNALKQTHEAQLYEVQKAAKSTAQNAKTEMELLEGNIERLKSENNLMRRSLNEAIHRLQSTQEDVIDRNVMKNILLDWCMLKDQAKRHQVLEVMANLLHFSEEEKEKVHLTSVDLDSVRARVVSALAAPLPPPKADVEHLKGDNVREKWINFLMAETDDS
jgi:hypothetical protein